MPNFFSEKEYQQIAYTFLLGEIQRIEYFRQGYQTPKVAVTTQDGTYVIAKHTLSSRTRVVADMKIVLRSALLHEISLLHTLVRGGLPVPRYKRSRRHTYLENFRGYAVSVYEYIPGRQPKIMTEKMVRQLGKFVGAFHTVSRAYRKPMSGRRKFYDLTPRVMRLMERIAKKQVHPRLKAVVDEVQHGVETYRPPRGLPRGPIHVDIKPDNELFVGEQLIGVIDFGNFYRGPLVFDVGKTIMWNCVKKGVVDPHLMSAFLQGYETRRRLSGPEHAYLTQAILYAIYSHLWVDLYHVPLRYVPERYTRSLVKQFLPIARRLSAMHSGRSSP